MIRKVQICDVEFVDGEGVCCYIHVWKGT